MLLAPLIKFEKEEEKPTWKVYQVCWADADHNKLQLIPSWDNNRKGKQKEKLTWNANYVWRTDNNLEELATWKWKKIDKRKEKKKKKEPKSSGATNYNFYTTFQQSTYHCPKLISTLRQPNFTVTHVLLNTLRDQNELENGTMNPAWPAKRLSSIKKCGTTSLKEEESVKCLNECPHDDDEIWQIALTKIEEALPEEIKTIKNNSSEPIELN
ncbi:hypothetical protein G9A89_004319 [Geosiphon pyriformis]|nr:hypothetical protein G9A89_004319 [Geosiphon pyriformis]